jgi:3-oxoacyl-ACP reductase-like protein
VLLEKWHSEQAAWGKALTLCGVRIGWVRGTGLMEAHDAITPRLEAASGLQTFSVEEMGAQLAHLCREETRSAARQAPLRVDLTGGFSQVTDLPGLVARLRGELEAEAGQARRQEALIRQYGAGVGRPVPPGGEARPGVARAGGGGARLQLADQLAGQWRRSGVDGGGGGLW